MAVLAVLKGSLTGNGTVAAPVAASAGGDSFANDSRTVILATNASGASITITALGVGVDDFGLTTTGHDQAFVVPAGQTRLLGPFPTARFNDGTQKTQLTYSASAGLTLTPISL